MQEILITGTDGFIGGILKDHFEKEGFRVFGTTFFRDAGPNEVKFDIQKEEEMVKLPVKLPERSFDAIVHTIALVDQTLPMDLVRRVNAEGTRKMVEWGKRNGVKHFIQISSVAVYGNKVIGENIPETTPRCTKGNPYPVTKAEAERIIEQANIPYTMVRLPPLVGPNDTFLTPTILPRLLKGTFYFTGKKDRTFSTLYVRNLGPVISAIIKKGPQNTIFNCADYLVKWKEFIAEYVRQLGISMPSVTKSFLVGLFHLRDRMEAMTITYSYFGASYNNARLAQVIGLENMTQFKWQDGVHEAIDTYFKKHPEIKDPRNST
ncbi:MAG: 3-beta hydroxysteroid dehydrogenase/isomerase family protein [Promethearchaeota archaeon CR_4]|nr:MAG: 3-beta hydroxysteroid dehydrogenase/isomerase family protein [Candidatus Lokiarchaeota archaeon CR_4]